MPVLTSKEVKTRKEHVCFLCLRTYPATYYMHYSCGIYDGEFSSAYTCPTCHSIIQFDESDEEWLPEGYVHEMLEKDQTPEMLLKELQQSKTKQQ